MKLALTRPSSLRISERPIECPVWKPAYFEFQSYGGTWQKATIAFFGTCHRFTTDCDGETTVAVFIYVTFGDSTLANKGKAATHSLLRSWLGSVIIAYYNLSFFLIRYLNYSTDSGKYNVNFEIQNYWETELAFPRIWNWNCLSSYQYRLFVYPKCSGSKIFLFVQALIWNPLFTLFYATIGEIRTCSKFARQWGGLARMRQLWPIRCCLDADFAINLAN